MKRDISYVGGRIVCATRYAPWCGAALLDAMYVGVLNIKHARVRACDVRLIRAMQAAAGHWVVCKSAFTHLQGWYREKEKDKSRRRHRDKRVA